MPKAQSDPAPAKFRKEEEANIIAAFQKWDLAKNGYISESELEQVLASLGIERKMVTQIFKDVDRNRDNKIDYQEFVSWLFNSASKQPLRALVFPTYRLMLTEVLEVRLMHNPSFDGWFSDYNSIRPYVRWRDLFSNRTLCQSPEGLGLESRIPLETATAHHEPLVFEILEDNFQAVGVDVCLARTLRGPKTLGTAILTLAHVAGAIAAGLGAAKSVVLEVKSEGTQAHKSEVVGKVIMSLVEHTVDDPVWAKHKVQHWKRHGLPNLSSMLEVHKVLLALTISPEANLIHNVPELAQDLLLRQVEGYEYWEPDRAQRELRDVAQWLDKLQDTVQRSFEVNRLASPKISETGEKVAVKVLTDSLKRSNHQLMRHAMQFTNRINAYVPEMSEVETNFRSMLGFHDNIRLNDLLMASELDVARMEPKDFGLHLETDGEPLPKVDETLRYQVRDDTAERVLRMLGCVKKINPQRGDTYERLAMDLITSRDFTLPGLLSALLESVKAFPGAKGWKGLTIQERIALRHRDLEALLGQFDVLAMPVRAEYDKAFVSREALKVPETGKACGFFGADPAEVPGGRGWFWALHAAALNIGENTHASDFEAYSMPADTRYRGRNGRGRWLDEDRYVADMHSLWHRTLQCAQAMGIEDMIMFPFGMGAFLRNLHQLDNRYSDVAAMRRLKKSVAQGLFAAAAVICTGCSPPMRVHVCLIDGSLEARMNHNVFVEAAGAEIKKTPTLAPLLKFHRNVDASDLAHSLSFATPPKQAGPDTEVRRVAILNGANNKLLGNHWFSTGARNAIDENLHRRSGAMCVASLLVNMSTVPLRRDFQELAHSVEALGGKSVELTPFPEKAEVPATNSRLVAHVTVVPFGVLGTQMTRAGTMVQKGAEPDPDTAVLDPAGLPFIQHQGPLAAGGSSRAIYTWLGITEFPPEVKAAITKPQQAKYHAYGSKRCIHVVGPNFSGRRCAWDEGVAELAEAYQNLFTELAASGAPKVRILPVSGSIFAGSFAKDMPNMTVQALQMGFEALGPAEQDAVLGVERLEMCIFNEGEYRAFKDVFKLG